MKLKIITLILVLMALSGCISNATGKKCFFLDPCLTADEEVEDTMMEASI